MNRPVTIQARRSEGAVSRPSRLLVTRRIGMRSRAGKSPK